VFYVLRRVPPWLVVVVVGAVVILGLTAVASASFGSSSPVDTAAALPASNPVAPSTDPAESSRSAAAARNSADQIAFLAAAAKIASSSAAAQPAPAASSSPAPKRTTTNPAPAPSASSPTPQPTETTLTVQQSCALSTQEVVAVYDHLNTALTNNDAVNQGLLLTEQVADFEIIAFYTPDRGAATIAIGLAHTSADLQAVLIIGDSHAVTTAFDAKVAELQNYCGSVGA